MTKTGPAIVPSPSPAESLRLQVLLHFARIQLPAIELSDAAFQHEIRRTFAVFLAKSDSPVGWSAYLDGFYTLDWFVAIGCLERLNSAWELLFAARTGRTDCLLVDALRARACRLYPRNDEKQESSVAEFWSRLIAPENEASTAILTRYDGKRPLTPWLIRVFQNWHLSQLRSSSGIAPLPDDDLMQPLPGAGPAESRWHEAFLDVGREWIQTLTEAERLILGLRWRYRLSQREVATLLGVHEGTISRQTDKLRDRSLEYIGERLTAEGWIGDDLEGFVLTEMGNLLLDEPSLGANALRRLLAARGKDLPNADEV